MRNKPSKVVILGSGWLGSKLSSNLQQIGVNTQETCRSKLLANEKNIHYFNVNNSNELNHNINLDNAYWVVCITPRDNYIETLTQAIKLAKNLNMKGFLLCSSTGIYPSEPGEYNESSALKLETTRQKLLNQAEQAVLNLKTFGKVVRLAGLIGPNRHPGKFVSGKHLKSSGLATVNMVHQRDVINGIICLLAQWQVSEQVYNLIIPDHPTKQDFYHNACSKLKTVPPTFEQNDVENRIIDGSKITRLGFEYDFKSLFDAILDC